MLLTVEEYWSRSRRAGGGRRWGRARAAGVGRALYNRAFYVPIRADMNAYVEVV
jgi:hypothetical protein